MLKLRIIPVLLWNGTNLVKGIGFDKSRKIGSLLPAIRVFNNRLVDELVLFDVAATLESRDPDVEAVRMASQHLFVPLTFGGGVKTIDHMQQLFAAGADKICLNSVLFDDLGLLERAVAMFGSQSIVAAIDFRQDEDDFYCVRNAGTIRLDIKVSYWIDVLQKYGVGEIILTSVDKDGTFLGYELGLINSIKDKMKVPLIVSGGFGDPRDSLKVLEKAKVAGFGIGSAFFFTEQTPKITKQCLKNAHYPVRLIQDQI